MIYGNENEIIDHFKFSYQLCVLIFFALTMYFCFGDIKDTKNLQAFVVIGRFVSLGLMVFSTVFYLGKDGLQNAPVFDWKNQLPSLANVFGNTVFTFIYQPAVPGIILPVRPQSKVSSMFIVANWIAAVLLFIEAQLAWMAFSGLSNSCDAPQPVFPCAVAPLFNENFLNIPVVGQICVFYPMLNVATATV